jgi:class 3 adenylate cyclase
VLAQVNVEGRGNATLAAPESEGRYRLFARGGAGAALVGAADGPAEAAVAYARGTLSPAELRLAPGGTVRIETAEPNARPVKLERLEYGSAAATAHDLAMLPAFRTIFSGQLLKRGTPLKVSRTAILFTDLTGSTALYNTVGDAAAFRLVDDHFDVLRAAVSSAGGTVIKTMGDAIMAAFPDARSCVDGALRCLRRFETFRGQQEHGPLVHLKLGLFTGACYVITANGTLDYFGQTVNVASRLQHLAESGEIVLEHRELDALDAELRAELDVSPVFETRVKGVDRALEVVRVRSRAPASSE